MRYTLANLMFYGKNSKRMVSVSAMTLKKILPGRGGRGQVQADHLPR